VAAAFAGENNVIVAEVDVTKNQDLGKTYDVSGFPTLKFFPAGEDRSPVDYESSREADGMLEVLLLLLLLLLLLALACLLASLSKC
jgi:protein disulfide-isomerase A6